MIPVFIHPPLLLLALAVVPACLFFFVRYRKAEKNLRPFFAVDANGVRHSLARTLLIRSVCWCLAWIFLVCAAAGPRWGTRLAASRQEGSSVMFVIDISRSMTLTDIPPSRLVFASRYASLLTERMGKASCGVVLAKGAAVVAIPLTSDHRAVRDLLESLSPALLTSPGSGLAQGITAALAAFPKVSGAARTIILFTDGDETSGSLEDAARAVRNDGALLVIVGTGTSTGAEISVYPGANNPQKHVSQLREDLLKKAAKIAGSGSFYIRGIETGSAYRVLDAALSSGPAGPKLVYSSEPVYRYFEFLLASIICFCAGCIVGGLVWREK